MYQDQPSTWVRRFVPLIRQGGRVLDLAAGGGRHTRLLLDMGFAVTAVDRDVTAIAIIGGRSMRNPRNRPGNRRSGGGDGGARRRYDGVVVTNYLHRPLLPGIAAALAPDGVLIYETFAAGNERFGRPRNPDFLLRPGELLDAFAGLTIVAFEQGEVSVPRPAIIQRIAAVAGPRRAASRCVGWVERSETHQSAAGHGRVSLRSTRTRGLHPRQFPAEQLADAAAHDEFEVVALAATAIPR